MFESAGRRPPTIPPATAGSPAGTARFRLVRYFTLTSLVAFCVVGLALVILQQMEESFFVQVQREQAAYFAKVQDELARQQDEAARANLIAVHEVAHVNLARVFANTLWASDFGPFVARVQQLPVDACRALSDDKDAAGRSARRSCLTELGATIRALPGFAAIDAKAQATMRDTTVFKIKVFDQRGITVYSSEPAQVGEEARGNHGWISASAGQVASELTHRDRFSAFEGVVENRDLISSYLPVRRAAEEPVLGVFEIYSDVTPLLEQIKRASAATAALAKDNLARLDAAAAQDRHKISAASARLLAIIGGLFVLLYLALLVLVRRAQILIERQAQVQEQAMQREAVWHREKMAALATMAASFSHEVGNPLAIIAGIAEDNRNCDRTGRDCPQGQSDEILAQTRRIAQMMREIADFAIARSDQPEVVDLNAMVKAVCGFLGFDARFRAARIVFQAGESLPACIATPDHLNEVLMSLLQACADERAANDRLREPISVRTEQAGDEIRVTIECQSPAPPDLPAHRQADARFELARRRVAAMGGRLSMSAGGIEIGLRAATGATVTH